MTTTTTTQPNYKVSAEHPEAENGQQELTGYRTVVRDGSNVAYDSQREYGRRGIFPAEATAIRHGERWIAAQAELAETIARVKREREAALPKQMQRSMDYEAELKDEASTIRKSISDEQKRRAKWVKDALYPQVAISFPPPGAEDFVITIKPSSAEDDGAEDADPATEQPEQQAEQPSEDGEAPKADEAQAEGEGKPSTTDGKGKPAKPSEPLPNMARPAGMLVHDELIAAIGRIKGNTLRDRVDALLEAEGDPLRTSTVAALLWAESCRASTKPRTSLLAFLENAVVRHSVESPDEVEVSDADRWAALLLCYSVGAPKTEHVEAGVPLIVDLAVIRYVQTVESGRGKSARPAVIALCEERLAELYDQGGAA